MKSVSIQICNVGPFKNEFIDFEEAGDMFLISGKTGSGKTTIFDCMTYALYGSFPGDRNGCAKEMRSKFAEGKEKSFVEFTFSVAGAVYCVTRTLPFEKKPAQVSLKKLLEDGSWLEAEGGTKKIDSIIENDLIHLEMKEFNRIIMLPQGEFASFLKQNSNERSKTLSKLFPVEKYSRIISILHDKCVQYEGAIKEKEATKLAFGDFDEEKAKNRIIALENELKMISLSLSAKEKGRDETLSALHNAKTQLEKEQKAQTLSNKLSKLNEKEDEIDEKRSKLEKSNLAKEVLDFIRKESDAKKRLDDAQTKCNAYENALNESLAALSALKGEKERIKTLEAQQIQYDLKLSYYSEQKTAVASAKKAQEEALEAKTQAENAQNALLEIKNEIDNCAKDLKAIGEKWGAEKNEGDLKFFLSTKINECEKTLDILNRHLSDEKNCKAIFSEIDKIRGKIEELKEQTIEQQKALDVTTEALSELEEAKKTAEQNEMASHLALLLAPGMPCPVCGSKEHPLIAKKSSSFTMDDKIAALKKNIENASKQIAQLKTQETSESALLQAKSTQADEILSNLELFGRNDLEQYEVEKSEKIEEITNQIFKLKADFGASQDISEKIDELSKTLSDLEEKSDEAEKNHAVRLSVLKEKMEALGEISDEEEISKKIGELTEKKESEQKEIEDFSQKLSESEQRKAEAEGGLASAKDAVSTFKTELESAKETCAKKLSKSPFSSREEAESAFIAPNEEEEMKSEIENWQKERSETQTLIAENRQEKSASELENEIESLSEKEKELAKQKDEALSQKSEVESEKRALESKISNYASFGIEYTKLLKEAAPYKALFEDISGKGVQGEDGKKTKKTSLDTWVLALYFSEILEAANPKLDVLSSGRYQFKIDTDRSSGNAKTGLDFVMEDSYTGQSRLPQTLSGGETFEASISLALALTEVVQSRNGGVRLESLFIDEGFGTLDDEALKKAMEVLRKIQENRVVGVISHVGELASEIPSQIFVKKERTGSAVFVNGKRCKKSE